jgi:hypothetical protein
MGTRMQHEYDFSALPRIWQRWGLVYLTSDSLWGPNTTNTIISIPYWLIETIPGIFLGAYAWNRRKLRCQDIKSAEESSSGL